MKYSIDTYRLYRSEAVFSHAVRIVVNMKETVDISVLDTAVNVAIKRYPYFAVKVTVDEDGGYVLEPNNEPVLVIPETKRVPKLGEDRVNGHLLFVTCTDKEISFYISHSMCGGRGFLPWVMTSVYEYVVEKYGVTPNAPGIRKPNSELLPGETEEPTMENLSSDKPIFEYKSKDPTILGLDYLNGITNPFKRAPNYHLYTFPQKEIMKFAKENDMSVAAVFLILMAKMLDKVLPEKNKVIGGEIAHNPTSNLGLKNAHCDLLSHVHIDYERDVLKKDMSILGTMTRGQMILQTDPTVSSEELRKLFLSYEELDKVKGLKQKRKYTKNNDPSTGKDAKHGTYIVNYSGQMDWGEVADYVESYVIVVEGHLLLEITSMSDKIFVSFMQLLRDKKYINAFNEVLEELQIPYKLEGPFPKRLSKHFLPEK